ncbi:MAG: hypothetical protein K1X75_14570 [Leptospirales bacterium]|nr:hypothetical protein [Leptospirales bacterium]
MNKNVRKAIVWAALVLLSTAALILAPGYMAQERFDPASVQPADCRNGRFRCGYQPLPVDRFAAIELSEQTQVSHRGLPSSVDLSSGMPPVGNQGQQGSCVAWSTTYYTKSFHENAERSWGFDAPVSGGQGAHIFSPAWTYNQINGGRDEGSVINSAMNLMVQRGAASWKTMPYRDSDYRTQPGAAARQEAGSYRARSYRAIGGTDLNAIKAELAAGNPVNFGIAVDENFYSLQAQVYDRRGGQNYGGHAMTLVGYDDSKRSPAGHVGAFKLINSWGNQWGDRGFGWISYRMWQQLQPQVLVMYDVRESQPQPQPQPQPSPAESEGEGRLNPPAGFTASKGSFTDRVELRWSAVQGATVYVLFRAPSTSPDNFQQLGYAQELSYADTSVQPGVAYRYGIVAAASNENYSDPERSPVAEGYAASRPADTNARPARVVGLEGEASGAAVRLQWTATAGAQRYQIARRDSRNNSYRLIGQSSQATHTDRAAVVDAENAYIVRAVNGAGAGPWSSATSVRVAGQNTPPSAPQGVEASNGIYSDHIDVTWQAVNGAQSYYIYRYDYDAQSWSSPQQVRANRFRDDSEAIQSGGWYAYTVAAANGAGASDYAEAAIGRANPNAERAGSALPPPANLRADLLQQQQRVTLRWQRTPGASSYYVFRKKKGESRYQQVATLPAAQTTFSERLPERGELYFYVVRSKPELGPESEDSNAVAAFANAARERATERALPGFGFDRFEGQWRGEAWDGEGPPVEVILMLRGDGDRYSGEFRYGSQPTRRFQGAFASGATAVESPAGLRLNLLGEQGEDLASVQILSGSLSQMERDFTVTRNR